MTEYMKKILQKDLLQIDGGLRVSTNIVSLIRAVDKMFSLCANYPKGKGDLFRLWMKIYHPGALLLHLKNAQGSRQDICVESAGSIYWNRPYWVEFLDETLRVPGVDNILEENLFVVLTSVEMISLTRAMSIVHLSICLPVRWLAANTHTLSAYAWGVRSMGRVIDTLEKSLVRLKEDSGKISDESFMMGFFQVFVDELPPLNEYVNQLYEKRTQGLVPNTNVADSSKTKVVPFCMLREELFNPQNEVNIQTNKMMPNIGKIVADALLCELRDPKKATSEHLSSIGGHFSWDETTEEEKKMGLRFKLSMIQQSHHLVD